MLTINEGDKMAEKINVRYRGETYTVQAGTSLNQLIAEFHLAPNGIAGLVNNVLKSLHYEIEQSCELELLDLTSSEGSRIYRNSLVFVMVRAAKDVLGDCRVIIEHALSNGIYGEIHMDKPLTEEEVLKIEQRMLEIILADEPFVRHRVSVKEACEIFTKQNLLDKVRLLEQSTEEYIDIHSCGNYYDTISDVFVPSTGHLVLFKLRFYLPGFILEYPKKENPLELPRYIEHGKLANVYYEAEKWGKNLGVSCAACLNDWLEIGKAGDLIRMSEAYHEKQISRIADQIAFERDRLRIILIAGPSSSGKTTFSQRLLIQLRINQLHPVVIHLDDYFIDRELTPIDEDGDYDFEALEAIDVKLFNEHLSQLIQGEAVNIPSYNFVKGRREWHDRVLQIGPNQPIIVEGIHGLNDVLTSAIPKGRKFKIYVSALTQINIDDHTRIPTTDARLIRRIIRDRQFRSHTAIDTIERWPSVRRGEEKYIFPFQEDADVMFNSALDYELAVLKKYAEPWLKEIPVEERAYVHAQRLLKLLNHFKELPTIDDIPRSSILMEFLGGSCFNV